ncbi:MAG TPA: CopD family protein, partial [Ilumatobacteraceae bacterium]|nr:CopD family protein [Ilumatobacteraceae bacterium]
AWQMTLVGATVAVGVASAFGGHGAAGRWVPLAIAATAVHVAAMAVWFGGLVALTLNWAAPDDGRSGGAAGLRRFSTMALVMVILVVVSGVVQAYRQLGSWQAFTESSYGGILLWKLALVALILAVASVSRKLVAIDQGRLRRAVLVEVVIAVAIVATTSLLMGSNPTVAAQSGPFSVQLVEGDYLLAVQVTPARVGTNEMHLFLSNATSSLSQPDDVTVRLSDPNSDLAPIDVEIARSGAGHYTAYSAQFPYAADWQLTVTARYNQFDQITFTTTVKVR